MKKNELNRQTVWKSRKFKSNPIFTTHKCQSQRPTHTSTRQLYDAPNPTTAWESFFSNSRQFKAIDWCVLCLYINIKICGLSLKSLTHYEWCDVDCKENENEIERTNRTMDKRRRINRNPPLIQITYLIMVTRFIISSSTIHQLNRERKKYDEEIINLVGT